MNRDLIKWFLVLGMVFLVFKFATNESSRTDKINDQIKYTNISYSVFTNDVENKAIKKVEIYDSVGYQYKVIAHKDSSTDAYVLYLPYSLVSNIEFSKMLVSNDVQLSFKEKESESIWTAIIGQVINLGLLFLFMWFIFGFIGKKSNGGIMGMMKHKGKVVVSDVKFSDVAGNSETIEEIKEIVDFLKDPQRFFDMGAKIPTGLLMSGPPGTGKTLLAKAVSGEAGVPFISLSGSDFVELFAGLASSRVTSLFKEAREKAPCIIFIDELDAIGKSRGRGFSNNDEREQALNKILVEMDGIGTDRSRPVIVLAATNRPDELDPALLRPGRFDRQVTVGLPDVGAREKILKIHSKNLNIASDVNWNRIAKGTPGFSGADLANLCNEAALMAGRKGKKEIDAESIEEAKDKILMGVRHGFVMTPAQKSLTAYHEAGHAIVGWVKEQLNTHDSVYKVSIIPRGQALGVTIFTPESDRISYSREEIKASIATLYAGRIAETMAVGEDKTTTGASNDIDRATGLAYNYVTKWGLDGFSFNKNDSKINGIGPVYYGRHEKHIDGRERLLSDHDLETIDSRVRKLLEECYSEAYRILENNKYELEEMRDLLVEKETIDVDDIQMIMNRRRMKQD